VDLKERDGATGRRHPWELARAEFFVQVLGGCGLLETGRDWLDIGSGDGWLAGRLGERLADRVSITCWDVNYTPADLASTQPGLTFVAERPLECFDRILMLDVIEHVADDVAFVSGVADELLAPEGWLLVSVPSYQSLFSSHDRLLCHFRRYSPGACRNLLERSGLSVVIEGGLFHSLLLMRAAQVLIERARRNPPPPKGAGAWQAGAATTWLTTRALLADGGLSLVVSRRGHVLPGLSYWALCRHTRDL
jgi:SAM-dependent methyltransferase